MAAEGARQFDVMPEGPNQEPDLVAAAREESKSALKAYLKQVDSPERDQLKNAVRLASTAIQSVWKKGIDLNDVYIQKFSDNQVGESTPGNLSEGIMISSDLLHPFARAKFIEAMIHEAHHVHGNLNGEEGEIFVRAMTSQYSNLIQTAGYEDQINALEEMANIFGGGDKMKAMRDMALMYVTEPKNLYRTFIRQYCAKNGVSPFALWYNRSTPFEAGKIFSKSKDGRKIPEIAEEGHQLFAKAFPELASAQRDGLDGGIDWKNAANDNVMAANDN